MRSFAVAMLLAALWTPADAAVRAGDADGDGERTTADAERLIRELFDGDEPTTEAVGGGDVATSPGGDTNDDGFVDAADLVEMPNLLLAPFWELLPPLPSGRQEVGVAEVDGKIYVVGGLDNRAQPVATVERFDPDTSRWESVAPLPERLHHVPVAVVDGRLYTLGGLGPSGFSASALVFGFDPRTESWQRLADMPTRRGAGAAAAIDGRIYVAGGLRGGSIADFAVYDPGTDRWTTLPAMPTARDHLGAAGLGGLFYAIAGRAASLFDVVEIYDPVANMWSAGEPIPTARGGLAVVALRGRIFAIGGEGNAADPRGIFHEVEAFDPDAGTWESLPPMAVGRHGIGAAVARGRIHVPGGATIQGFAVTDTHDVLLP